MTYISGVALRQINLAGLAGMVRMLSGSDAALEEGGSWH